MKVTEKIVTSVTQPQQTNVMWHNPDTGEFKIFGGKGWENAGGNPGQAGSSFSGGYPVVTVENDFNIEAQPNTFYNIKNSPDNKVNINFKDEEFYIKGLSRHIFFTCVVPEGSEEAVTAFSMVGGRVSVSDRPEFKYQMYMSMGQLQAIAYFSDEIKTGNSVTALFIEPGYEGSRELQLSDIVVLNENLPSIMYFDMLGFKFPFVISEIENDNDTYNHKYQVIGYACIILNGNIVYSQEPFEQANVFYTEDGQEYDFLSMGASIEVQPNLEIIGSKVANEFVFSLNTPFDNVVFDKQIQWNNDNIPDTSKVGTITISIVNGVACYTFV